MSPSVKTFWWIDDDDERVQKAIPAYKTRHGTGATSRSVNVELVHVPDGKWDSVQQRITDAKKDEILPDLIMIDQMLQNNGRGLSFKGSSLAMAVRGELPHVPIVLLSAGDPPLSRQIREGVDFFTFDEVNLAQRFDDLWAIAEGFAMVRSIPFTGSLTDHQARISEFLGIPQEDCSLFQQSIPGEFLAKWDDETIHSFTRWTWKVFLDRPGFLLDEWHLATLLGITLEGLPLIKKRLRTCLYSNAFVSPTRPRWWASSIRRTLVDVSSRYHTWGLWQIGRDLTDNKFNSKAFARDVNAVPTCVAWMDELKKKRVQTMREDTEEIPYDTPSDGFTLERVFRGVKGHGKKT